MLPFQITNDPPPTATIVRPQIQIPEYSINVVMMLKILKKSQYLKIVLKNLNEIIINSKISAAETEL